MACCTTPRHHRDGGGRGRRAALASRQIRHMRHMGWRHSSLLASERHDLRAPQGQKGGQMQANQTASSGRGAQQVHGPRAPHGQKGGQLQANQTTSSGRRAQQVHDPKVPQGQRREGQTHLQHMQICLLGRALTHW